MNYNVIYTTTSELGSTIVGEVELKDDRVVMKKANPSAFPDWAREEIDFISNGLTATMHHDSSLRLIEARPTEQSLPGDPPKF